MHGRIDAVIVRVQAILDQNRIQYALIGGMAVAARGYPRFTIDFDFLTTDRRVLQATLWDELRNSGIGVDVRKTMVVYKPPRERRLPGSWNPPKNLHRTHIVASKSMYESSRGTI